MLPLSQQFEPDLDRSGLLVVDMQHDDAHRDFALGEYLSEHDPEAYDYFFGRVEDSVIPGIVKLLADFRQAGVPVVHVTNGHTVAGLHDYLPHRRERARILNFVPHVDTKDYEILPECQPMKDEVVFLKRSTSAFNSTGIDAVLRNMDIRYLFVVGVSTDACVGLTARDASDLGYGTTLVSDCTATFSDDHQNAFERIFQTYHGPTWSSAQLGTLIDASRV